MAERRMWWVCLNPIPLVFLLGLLLALLSFFLR
jgi:hypothetical protein